MDRERWYSSSLRPRRTGHWLDALAQWCTRRAGGRRPVQPLATEYGFAAACWPQTNRHPVGLTRHARLAMQPQLLRPACGLARHLHPLDVVRAPVRGWRTSSSPPELLTLTALASPQCRLVVRSFVVDEWADPRRRSDLLGRHLETMEKQAPPSTANAPPGIAVPFSPPDYGISRLAARLRPVPAVVGSLGLGPRSGGNGPQATTVAVSKRRPCRQGGELGLPDLRSAWSWPAPGRRLRPEDELCTTSNTDDYCARVSSHPMWPLTARPSGSCLPPACPGRWANSNMIPPPALLHADQLTKDYGSLPAQRPASRTGRDRQPA